MPTIYRKREHVVARKIEGELVLVPIQREAGDLEHIYLLNEVGAFVWDRIDGRNDLAAIQADLLREFEVEPDVAAHDVAQYLEKLAEYRCIEPVGGDGA